MNEVYDFENKRDYDKTLKLVKSLKPAKKIKGNAELKFTGRITQVVCPNELIIKTKWGKHIPVVFTGGSVNAIFERYNRSLVIIKDSKGEEHTLDVDYDVTVIVGKPTSFVLGDNTYENIGYEFNRFFGIER